MRTIEKTIEFIKEAHKGVFDKGGHPYWMHPYAVMLILEDWGATEDEKIAALLHDTVEDVEWITYEYLREMGYNENVIDIIKLVTKDPDDYRPYHVWIQEIVDTGHVGGIKVKKADMKHNRNHERMSQIVDEKRLERMKRKYRKGWAVIMEYESER